MKHRFWLAAAMLAIPVLVAGAAIHHTPRPGSYVAPAEVVSPVAPVAIAPPNPVAMNIPRPEPAVVEQKTALPELADNPGTHFNDEVTHAAEARWKGEVARGPAKHREKVVHDFFSQAGAEDVLDNIECRDTLCQLTLDGDKLRTTAAGRKQLTGRLGQSVAVVRSDDAKVVVLLPSTVADSIED